MTAQPVPAAPYQPRRFQQLGLWAPGPLQLKAYGTTWRDQPGPPVDLQQAARVQLSKMLPAYAEAEGHHGLGFAVLHEGQQGSWLLMDWWAHSHICCQLVAHAPEGSLQFTPVDRGAARLRLGVRCPRLRATRGSPACSPSALTPRRTSSGGCQKALTDTTTRWCTIGRIRSRRCPASVARR